MPISATTRRALNLLGKFEPGLSPNRNGGTQLLLGDIVAQCLAGGDFKTSVQLLAVPTAVADATDLTTAQALANDLKSKWNAFVNGVDAL